MKIGSLLTASAHADLFISQYVEGAATTKRLRLPIKFGDSSMNLDGYSIREISERQRIMGATLPGWPRPAQEVTSHSSASDGIKASLHHTSINANHKRINCRWASTDATKAHDAVGRCYGPKQNTLLTVERAITNTFGDV
ncbi:hypothetical protein O9993_20250 [Vibrio lentus]|nr:hypothetical protein [Vibrio lentus]